MMIVDNIEQDKSNIEMNNLHEMVRDPAQISEKEHSATAVAGSNIAFVKYWGNWDDRLNIPMNDSISMTLDAANTRTTVTFSPEFKRDQFELNGKEVTGTGLERVSFHLEYFRELSRKRWFAQVRSENSFPTGAGIASSASGFAALTVAAAAALKLELPNFELSRIARLGSGSASRSIDGGFVYWQAGQKHYDSYAQPLAGPEHWDLVDIVAIVSHEHKQVGSSEGHPLAHSSPFYEARLEAVQHTLQGVRRAIMNKNLQRLGQLIEAEAISLHVAAMTSFPSVLYWQPGTIEVMQALRQWRADGGPEGYFTMDAGPNVHVICERADAAQLSERIKALPGVQDILVCGVGGGARLEQKAS